MKKGIHGAKIKIIALSLVGTILLGLTLHGIASPGKNDSTFVDAEELMGSSGDGSGGTYQDYTGSNQINSVATDATSGTGNGIGVLLDNYATNRGSYTLNKDSRFYIISSQEPTGELLQTVQLASREFAAAGWPSANTLEIVWGPEGYIRTGDIVVAIDSSLGAEAYMLTVSGTATVTGGDNDGLLYGFHSLLKQFRYYNSNTLGGFTALDVPDTKERTVMLDCARKYYTKEWICNFIRQISWMGYNTLQLHFSEDGGFRMDIWDPQYYTDNYRPENDFSWICGSKIQTWVHGKYASDPDAGKYLTTAEMVEILRVAQEYHIDVIPSFDTPGHMDYICWQFEQNYKANPNYKFTYKGTEYKASSTNGSINYLGYTGGATPIKPYTTMDITSGSMSRAFVFALYEDIADFFKEYGGSTDFSVGADEVTFPSTYSGYKWDYSKYPEYVNSLNRMLNAKGYTMRAYNDFIGSTSYNYNSSAGKCKYDFDDNIEIMYWNSDYHPNTGKWTEPIWHVKFFWNNQWGDGGRTIYNCIQTNCYYVLRVANGNGNMDARNPDNHNWTFYHSTEQDIYNEWYPADISEKGVYAENADDVPAANLGGGYFLIWNDYAALNTEAEVWNDVKDNTGTSNLVYSLFDRMWSNTIKMWNSDINSSLSYANYATLRETFGYFPGFATCSTPATLRTAKAPVAARFGDNTLLESMLKNKVSSTGYTVDSYAIYEAAYQNAVAVNNNLGSSDAEITEAIRRLREAEAGLIPEDQYLVISYKAMVGGKEYIVKPATVYEIKEFGEYTLDLEYINGYRFSSVDGAEYTPNKSGAGNWGTIKGKLDGSASVTVWYDSVPNTAQLELLIEYAETEQGFYTNASWASYKAVLDSAKDFMKKMNAVVPPTDVVQAHVDAMVADLTEAQQLLVVETDKKEIISVVKLSGSNRVGSLIGLKVTTSADVTSLAVDGVELTSSSCSAQTLDNGDIVKIWVIRWKATEAGTITYTIKADNTVTETVDVTVK